jgi:glyoxylase-like metal-dependent hydrolase (beta-lactamase superfamily II)
MNLLSSMIVTAVTAAAATTRTACATPDLQVDVYHAQPYAVHYQNSTSLLFSPTAFTLIHGAHEAVLVDGPALDSIAEDIAHWIKRTVQGKKLKYIYVTHGHLDHFGAFPVIQKYFPEAKVVATSGVIKQMNAQLAPEMWKNFWLALLPDLTKPSLDGVVTLPSDGKFYFQDRHEFQSISVGEGDTADSTVLYSPSIDLVVGGDVVYGHCYQYLAENPTAELRAQWLASLETVKALKPKFVVPSHTQESEGYGINHLEETEKYIRSYNGWLEKAKSWEELESFARQQYPDRIGEFILRYSAQSFFNATF